MTRHAFTTADRELLAACTAQIAVAADATQRARAVVDAISLSFGANPRVVEVARRAA
jgi:hypothetical protein